MKIGMVLNAPFPPDIRVEKEALSLLRDHEVALLCTKNGSESARATWNGMRIERAFTPAVRRVATLELMTACRSRIWLKRIRQFIDANDIDALHVHDLPLAGTAIEAARVTGIPVVLDLHENYPEMLRDLKQVPIASVGSVGAVGVRLTTSIPRWVDYERDVLPRADKLIVVVKEAADRVAGIGVHRSNIGLVPNYATPLDRTPPGRRPGRDVQAVYIGAFDHVRDMRTVILAAGILERSLPPIRILLVGGTRREISLLRRFAEQNEVSLRNVELREWIERSAAESLLDQSDIGLAPHRKSAHSDSTIPHKLFQYMACGLPVVVSNCVPLERVVTGAGCGLVYESGDARSLANCLMKLGQDEIGRVEMGRAGAAAVEAELNWDTAASNLSSVYSAIFNASSAFFNSASAR